MFQHRQSDLGGYSQIQNLLKQDNDQWIIHYDVNTDDQLTAAFLVHRSSIELLRSNPFFLWMDCTYKTNRYQFPLLDIIGESSVGKSFYIGLAFIANEREPAYRQVLRWLKGLLDQQQIPYPKTIMTDKEKALRNAVSEVFPETKTLICYWHVIKNIQGRLRPRINKVVAAEQPARSRTSQDHRDAVNTQWDTIKTQLDQVFLAHTKEDHELRWQDFRDLYDTHYGDILRYIYDEWINQVPEAFLRFHTKGYFHLNQLSTSRVEGKPNYP
jgi:transposase-like protein